MEDKKVQIKDYTGNNLFPKTDASIVINNAGASLENVEAGAQVNKIEKIKVNGVELAIINKVVEIPKISNNEYTMVKASVPESGFLSTYYLTKNDVQVGAKINIPKDMVVKSGSLKTCTQVNNPVQGYQVGDKFLDIILANAKQDHIYILVSDLIDNYEAGTGILISNDTISVNMNTLKGTFATITQLNEKAFTSDIPTKTSELTNDSGFLTKHQDISGKANKATTLAGYGITDAYTKAQIDNLNMLTYEVIV